MIKIGILPTYNENKENPFLDTFSFVNNYSKRILKAKGIPVGILFPDGVFNEKLLKGYDGFIIPGGTRIKLYHILSIHFAIMNSKPLLGICMGNQTIGIYERIINILRNQNKDINYVTITDVFRKIKEDDFLLKVNNHNNLNPFINKNIKYSMHKVYINKNTKLYDIYKKKEILMPSVHNFVLKDIIDDFLINSMSPEGYIEGIEHKQKFIIGVQFHPELIDNDIFEYFIYECQLYKL